jgi:enoyl-CoA hydratase/carnithine racemase
LLVELDAAVARADADTVGALVVTGRGSAFSAGVDLFRLVDEGAAYVDAFLPPFPAPGHRAEGNLLQLLVYPLAIVCVVAVVRRNRALRLG